MADGEMEFARALAVRAGRLVADALGKATRIDSKSGGNPVNLVTDVDRAVEDLIVSELRERFPSDSIVAEESAPERAPSSPLENPLASPRTDLRADAGVAKPRHSTTMPAVSRLGLGPNLDARTRSGVLQRAASGRCWYIDPIDGTTNFVHGLPQCAVSIALGVDRQIDVAVVNDPCKGELFEARRGGGARLNGKRISVSQTTSLADSLLVSGFPYDRRQHLGFYLRYFEAFMLAARDVRRLGSAALDLCYVACGRFDGFWEWKLSPWDTAAGWLIVEEAGGSVSDFDAGAYDPWLPRILATNGLVHDQARSVLSTLPRSP